MFLQRRSRSLFLITSLLILIVIITTFGATDSLRAAQDEVPLSSPQMDDLDLAPGSVTQLQAQKSQNPKVDSSFVDLIAAAGASLQQANDLAEARSLRLSGDRIQIVVETHSNGVNNATQTLMDVGGEVTATSDDKTLIQAWVPLGSLEQVAASDDVYMIRPPAHAYPDSDLAAGRSTTEGLEIINALSWHAAGFKGRGVRIGVIDQGFKGFRDLVGTDLPPAGRLFIRNFVDGESSTAVDGSNEHGTACAEIVYDIAPEATMYLARFDTELDLAEAVAWLISQRVDIISSSVSFDNRTPGDGTGFLAERVEFARSNGILWVTSAGNRREEHWGGLYSDPDGDGLHNFFGRQEINYFTQPIPADNILPISVRWDDWVDVNQDFDLFVVRWNGSSWNIIGRSDNLQNGGRGQTPTERVTVRTFGRETYYGFVIVPYRANRVVNFEFFARAFRKFSVIVPQRSISNLADAPAAMTVAALDVNFPFPQESYSSEGPTNGPGGTLFGGAIKPDIAAFANVSTESNGARRFNGTSSATPHVAGAAALVQGAFPNASPNQVREFLQDRAIERGLFGKDTVFGHGQLFLGRPPVPPATAFDFTGDGRSDILWRNTANGTNFTWAMNATQIIARGSPPATTPSQQVAGVADFNDDGRVDILWRDLATGNVFVWAMNGAQRIAESRLRSVNNPNWRIVATADFNGDGIADVLWRHIGLGWNYLWLTRGGRIFAEGYLPWVDPTWTVAATADFNGDSVNDILWRNTVTGHNAMWEMDGTNVANILLLPQIPDQNWRIVGVGDFNGDNRSDIIWRNAGTTFSGGIITIWLMNGSQILTTGSRWIPDPNWRVANTGDFNGDKRFDILWRNVANGATSIWLMDGLVFTEGLLPFVTPPWRAVGQGIYDGTSTGTNAAETASNTGRSQTPEDPGGQISPPVPVQEPSPGQSLPEPPTTAPDTNQLPPGRETGQQVNDLTLPPPADQDTDGVFLSGPDTRQLFLPLIQN